MNRKGQRERTGDNVNVPARRQYERNQRPIQKRGERETFRIQPAPHYVEHAQSTDQYGDRAVEMRPLFGEWRYVQNLGSVANVLR